MEKKQHNVSNQETGRFFEQLQQQRALDLNKAQEKLRREYTINRFVVKPLSEEVSINFSDRSFPGAIRTKTSAIAEFIAADGQASRTTKLKYLWLGFNTEVTTPDHCLKLQLKDHPKLRRLYMEYLLQRSFEKKRLAVQRDFAGNLCVWLPAGEKGTIGLYNEVKLRVQYDKTSEEYLLRVSFAGEHSVMKQALAWINEMKPNAADHVRKVLFDNQILHINALPPEAGRSPEKFFAVLNRRLSEALGLQWAHVPRKDKHETFLKRTEEFCHTHLLPDSAEGLRISASPEEVSLAGDLYKVRNIPLLFGKGEHSDLYKGLQEGGPYLAPPCRQLVFFFIYEKRYEILKEWLSGKLFGTAEKGLFHFIRTACYHEGERDIVLSEAKNAIAELSRALQTTSFEPGKQYVAIYLSPVSRFSVSTAMHSIYYRIRELLLKRGVMMQAIESQKLEKAKAFFNFWIPNIASAVIAKSGGLPWVLKTENKPGLVVGFGLYQTRKYGMRYLGASFCFDTSGRFMGYDAFPANDSEGVAAKLSEALRRYHARHGRPERMVVHYHKQMSDREFAPILQIIQDFDSKVELYVLKINESGTDDYAVRDHTNTYGYPKDGSVFRLNPGDYLLYRNGYDGTGSPKLQPMPLRIYIHKSSRPLSEAGAMALLEEVYLFTRLNWRSVGDTSLPVTVRFPKLYASQRAWFEGESLPQGVRERPWFL